MDVDQFKRVNDEHGHQAGDAVLAELGRRLAGVVKGDSLVGRYGGEEFLLVLPRHDLKATADVAERVRAVVASEPFDLADGRKVSVTVSVGAVAGYGSCCAQEGMVEEADRAMYAAKDAGRNRVEPRTVAELRLSGPGAATI